MMDDHSSEGEVEEATVQKYRRGDKIKNLEQIWDRKLKGQLTLSEDKRDKAARHAAKAELLLSEEPGFLEGDGLEKTYKFTQKQIAKAVDIGSAQKQFDLHLDKSGPYRVSYTRNGRHLLIGGQKGHIATIDWAVKKLGCEVHVHETIRDVQYLQNETMFAVAQKKYLYIYDNNGVEIHCIRRQQDVTRLDFLPYHFLLVSVVRGM
jgi:U3 small nucleolar RNA-associated protein 7